MLSPPAHVEHALAGERVDEPVERDAGQLLELPRDLVDVDAALDAIEDALRPAEGERRDRVGRNAVDELGLVVRVAAAGGPGHRE